MTAESAGARVPVMSLPRLALRFLRFGVLAWGGPVAQIAMLRRELVDEEGWISSDRFNRTLAVYQVLPGPEAQELCIYFGTLARGRLGGLLAGLCFLLPGFVMMLALAWWYVESGIDSPLFAAAFAGCQAAVLALIVRGLHRIGSRALADRYLVIISVAATAATLSGVHFAVPLLVGAVAYPLAARSYPGALLLLLVLVGAGLAAAVTGNPVASRQPDATAAVHPPAAGDLLVSGLRAGSLTFGGAYTAIPFVEDDATGADGWMTRGEFLDGIALSGVIPAPLVIFATFVGFIGGGFGGAVAMTAGIFLPAFAITLVGHRYLEAAVGNARMHAVLDGVAAGVVGIVAATVLQLATTAVGSLEAMAIFAVALASLYLWRAGISVPVVFLAAAAAGVLLFGI